MARKKEVKKIDKRKYPTLKLETDREIAQDFSVKLYKKFDKIIKAVVLFGSVAEKHVTEGSDVDIVVIIDDVSIHWDMELVAWYREELNKLLAKNPYPVNLHLNTIKLSTWWDGLIKGDPVILNVIRQGFPIMDKGGFFEPLKYLMAEGKIKSTPEMVYQCLQRAPSHLARSYAAELSAVEGIYWSMVESAHAALIAAGFFPASPEHVITDLRNLVEHDLLKSKYVSWYKDIFVLHKRIDHHEIKNLRKVDLDLLQDRAQEFFEVMTEVVKKLIESGESPLARGVSEKNSEEL